MTWCLEDADEEAITSAADAQRTASAGTLERRGERRDRDRAKERLGFRGNEDWGRALRESLPARRSGVGTGEGRGRGTRFGDAAQCPPTQTQARAGLFALSRFPDFQISTASITFYSILSQS